MFFESFDQFVGSYWNEIILVRDSFLEKSFGVSDNFGIGNFFDKIDLRVEFMEILSLNITFTNSSYTLSLKVLLLNNLAKQLIHRLSLHLFTVITFAVVIFFMKQVVTGGQYCHNCQDDHHDADNNHFETGEKEVVHLLLTVYEVGAYNDWRDWDEENAADW